MTDINLLPWRELKREQDKKDFTILLVIASCIAVVIAFAINLYSTTLLEDQAQINQRLKDEIKTVDNQITSIHELRKLRDNLISRMKVAQEVQSKRALTVHLFDELVKVLPDGILLTDVKRVGDLVTVHGYSESNSNVALLMRNIDLNPWIQNPSLTEIKMDKDTQTVKTANVKDNKPENKPTFILSFVLLPKNVIHGKTPMPPKAAGKK